MNKSKIIVFLLVTLAVGFWIASFIFKGDNTPKSKAAGDTMTLSFNPATSTVAANADFTVTLLAKPSIATILRGYVTKVAFDKTLLKLKSIEYKTGTASAGLGNTNADIATQVDTDGTVELIAEDATTIGKPMTTADGAELVSLTFTAISSSSATITTASSVFYTHGIAGTNMEGFLVEWSANAGTVTEAKLDVNKDGGGGGSGNVNLNMKLKFQGITKQPAAAQNSMNVKVKVYKEGQDTPKEGTGAFTSDANGIWSGKISVDFASVAGKYKIFVKGPQHIQKKVCDEKPTETSAGTYRCSTGVITLKTGDNDLDFSGVILLVGDLDQSGLVDSVDFGLVKNCLGKSDATCVASSDLNRDGKVDTQDFSLIIAALGVRTDEL